MWRWSFKLLSKCLYPPSESFFALSNPCLLCYIKIYSVSFEWIASSADVFHPVGELDGSPHRLLTCIWPPDKIRTHSIKDYWISSLRKRERRSCDAQHSPSRSRCGWRVSGSHQVLQMEVKIYNRYGWFYGWFSGSWKLRGVTCGKMVTCRLNERQIWQERKASGFVTHHEGSGLTVANVNPALTF